jgi:hypothetical protein
VVDLISFIWNGSTGKGLENRVSDYVNNEMIEIQSLDQFSTQRKALLVVGVFPCKQRVWGWWKITTFWE